MGSQFVRQDVINGTRNLIARFCNDRSGATAIEYGLIVSLIFLAILSGVQFFAGNAVTMFNDIAANVN